MLRSSGYSMKFYMHTCGGMLDEGSIIHSAAIHCLLTSYIAAIDLPPYYVYYIYIVHQKNKVCVHIYSR